MNMPLTIRAKLCLVLATAIIMSACTKQNVGTGGTDIAGEYELMSVDGKDVPATVSHGGVSLKVLSGTFTINADKTCSSKTVFVPPTGDEVEREVAATYTRVGSELTMQWEGAGITVGTVDGDAFTMNNEGMVLVYVK